MSLPLKDFRILDLSSNICGHYCTKLFADAGAEVIMVEPPQKEDKLRNRTLFHFLNTSKKSLVLDLETENGRQELFQLLPSADMLVLDDDVSVDNNPHLVVLSISPWGKDGEWGEGGKKFPANEFTLQSWVGAISHRGIPGEMPFGVGGQLGDFMTAASAAAAALGALLSAKKTGIGSDVDVSQFEAMLTSFVTYHHILEAFDPSDPKAPATNRSIEIPSIEPTSDGWVGFCTITGQQFQDFCVLIGDPEMGEDERFTSFSDRMDNREEAWERIAKYTTQHTTQEIIEQASLLRIPVAPIGNGKSVLDTDHFKERGIYVKNPAGFDQPRIPYQFEKIALRDFESAPELGQHTEEILGEPKTKAKKTKPRKVLKQEKVPRAIEQVLEGIRVCDISAFWAGPLAASFLGSLGADVIKVESPKRPDGMRFAGNIGQEKSWEYSPVFHGANCNKRDLTLDILSQEGMVLLKKLISTSDILIENYSPRVMENWGLTWDVVRGLNPKIIMVRMPAFGLTGPWRDRTGFAMTIEQASGLAFRTGDPNGKPMVPRGVCDPLGAMHSAFAVLLALKHREETEEGQLIEVPLVEVGLNAAAEQVVEWTANQKLLERMGNRSEQTLLQGVYPCKPAANGEDQWICISLDKDAPDKDALWQDFKNLIGMDENLEAPDKIDSAIAAWSKTQDVDVAVKAVTDLLIPAAPVIAGRQSLNHPQLIARGFHQRLKHPIAGEVPYTSFPFKIDGEYLEFKRHAPALGEHNEEILSEVLGLTAAEIKELETKGIIGTEPNFG